MNHTFTQLPVGKKQHLSPQKPNLSEKSNNGGNAENYLFLVVVLDILLLNLCLFGFLAMMIPAETLFDSVLAKPLKNFGILANVIWLVIVPFTNVYSAFEGIKLRLKTRELFLSTLIYFGIINWAYYQYFLSVFQVHFLLPAVLTFFVLATILHYVVRYYTRNLALDLSYAVVGGGSANIHYLEKVLSSAYGDQAHCMGRFAQDEIPGVNRLGTYEDIEEYLRKNGNINKLLYFYSDLSKQTVQRIIQLCRSRFIDFDIVPMGVDFFERGVQVEQLAHLPIFRRKKEPLCEPQNKILKRIFDVVFSLLVIVFIFPWLFPIVMLLIKLESKGPIFFVQKRTGYWSKPFGCIKFRTMSVNEKSDNEQATKGDIRITKVGAFLRKSNIDELPQFFNVLLGDMSVVGPRPHMVKHTEDYSKLIDRYMIRHEVKPGITGWAQVNGWRGPTEELYQMNKRVEYDVNYIENWNFWLDCKCIFLTVFNIFKGEENAF